MRNIEIVIHEFCDFCKHYLKLRNLPKIEIITDPLWPEQHGTFGYYTPEDDKFRISIADRHEMDILRTVGHELVHAKQREEGVIGAPRDIIEIQANRLGSMLIKVWGKKNPRSFANRDD
jgi:hypothetical protein